MDLTPNSSVHPGPEQNQNPNDTKEKPQTTEAGQELQMPVETEPQNEAPLKEGKETIVPIKIQVPAEPILPKGPTPPLTISASAINHREIVEHALDIKAIGSIQEARELSNQIADQQGTE